MNSKLRQFTLPSLFATVLSALAYRKTDIPNATLGHKHQFFSFYLTKALNLRAESGETIKPVNPAKLTLWVVPPGMFHEWITQNGAGTVWDITPMHRPHQLQF
jgi:hypothetical protein